MRPDVYTEYASLSAGQTVSRFDRYPCFAKRQNRIPIDPICWFGKFAAFDLFSDKLPEYGLCKYPEAQSCWEEIT